MTHAAEADRIRRTIGGYPVLVRPSYVLSVRRWPSRTKRTNCAASWRGFGRFTEYPVVVSKLRPTAREIESTPSRPWSLRCGPSPAHEDAGVHSGDATLFCAPEVYIATIRRVRQIATMLARAS